MGRGKAVASIQNTEQLTRTVRGKLYGYALMANHYRLQLAREEANLSKALHWLISATACGSIENTVESDHCFRDVSKPSSTSQ
jgi:hypothetical protein